MASRFGKQLQGQARHTLATGPATTATRTAPTARHCSQRIKQINTDQSINIFHCKAVYLCHFYCQLSHNPANQLARKKILASLPRSNPTRTFVYFGSVSHAPLPTKVICSVNSIWHVKIDQTIYRTAPYISYGKTVHFMSVNFTVML